MRRVGLFVLACCVGASATNYYVSSSGGSDSNSGTSPATAWKTFSAAGNHVNAGSFSGGDVIYLKRGDVWNEQLIPPSSGGSGNPIQFDAYGTGAAPVITAATTIPFVIGSWTYISGNVWRTSASLVTGMGAATKVHMVQFGAMYGRHQADSGCSGSIVGKYDWCVVWPNLYVYSGNGSTPPTTTYLADGAITAYVDSVAGLPLISVVNKNWITFQHIKVQGFSYIGVSVTGTSDNIVFANIESDGMLPYGTTPLGFYVNVASGCGTSIQFLNDDANLNYDGFRVDAATAVTVKNCRGYANRDAGLRDNTPSGTVVAYSNSHFYGNNVAQFPATDVVGGIAGSGNVGLVCGAGAGLPATMCSSTAAPAVTNFATYPARFSFTVDDVGSASETEEYINSFLGTSGIFSSRGLKFNAAVVPSYGVDWGSVNNWYASGNEIDSHSWSHQYYTTTATPAGTCTLSTCPNAPALKIQYTGSGSGATMTVTGTTLSTNVTGAPADNIIGIDLANPPYNQLGKTGTGGWGLANYLNTLPHYSVVLDTDAGVPLVRPNTYTVNLAGTTGSAITIAGQDIKSAPFVWAYDQTLLLADEMREAKGAIESNVSGLSVGFYVYPDGIEDASSEADAVAAGYTAARGSLAMKGQDNSTGSANSLYANGVNVQNITSLAAIQIHGMSQAQINQIAASLVFRAAAWGAPYGLFTHYNTRGDGTADISNSELGWLLDAVTANGGVWLTNTELANAITAGTAISGTTRYLQNPSGSAVNLAVALAHSPTVGRGAATTYPVDLDGVDRSKLGAWDIGAKAYLAQRYGAAGTTGSTRIGGWPTGQSVALPQVWVNSNEWMGTTANAIVFPASGSGGSWTCGGANYGPYTASSQSSLQQAINDAEACRTANGSGTTITIPAGAVFSGSAGITLPQTATDTSTNFIVLQSSSPLPTGRTVCSHGIQDNVAASTQQGIRNIGCNGMAMSYQLGTTVTTVSGAFTLANGTPTNTSAYNDIASMYTIECTINSCNAIVTGTYDANNIGPHHFAILNAELRPAAGVTSTGAIVKVGTATESLSNQRPSHIHVAYSYVHGDWTDAPVSGGVATAGPTGSNSIPNGMAFSSCVYCSVAYSYLDRMIRPGSEGHGIYFGFWDQIKVAHNWVEGESVGLFAGGFSTTVPLTGFGSDFEDRGNRYTYPYSWMLAAASGFCVNNLSCSGNSYVRKNSHELKVGNRILDDGNINENVDNTGAQNGIMMSWKGDNDSAGFGNNYWIGMQNVTRTNGIGRNTCEGMSWGYRPVTNSSNGGGVTQPTMLALFQNNLNYSIGTTTPGCGSVSPVMGFRVNQGGGNTWAASVARDSAGATSTLTLTSTPGGTQSGFNVGDPVNVSGCTDTSFNTSTTAMGPLALAGTVPTALTVIYANSGTANAVDDSGTCTVSNLQGWPRYLTHTHNSEFMNSTNATSPYSTASNGQPYQLGRNLNFTNDIFVGGGINSGWTEGTRTQTKAFDPATEVMHDILFPGRDSAVVCPGHGSPAPGGIAACYTEYSDMSVSSTPTTLYGVPTSYCTGNDPTVGGCSGILGAMSQSSFPAALADWHQYRLCHAGDAACNGKASLYSAGQANDASDGKDLGADLSQIEAAQTSTRYCNPNCGIGSFSDVP